ncbi:hypothetical protein QQF64_034356 [Cirrhinus molitorella]|uniref:Uncharacterized protein n=1 Tax=Cirrhinus molitorella TaxID=172907 RepID=A0ABR3L1J6_9TELE
MGPLPLESAAKALEDGLPDYWAPEQLPNECVLAAGARLLWIFESNLKRFVKMQWKCVNGVQQDCGKEPHEFYESIDRHILCLIEIFQSKRGNVGQLLTSFTTNQGL